MKITLNKPNMTKYKNIGEFRRNWNSYCLNNEKLKLDGTEYYCDQCHGYGKHKDPEDYDVIEGLKLAQIIKCSRCNGSGILQECQVVHLYKAEIEKYKKALKKYKDCLAALKRAFKSLKKEEADTIFKGWNGPEFRLSKDSIEVKITY